MVTASLPTTTGSTLGTGMGAGSGCTGPGGEVRCGGLGLEGQAICSTVTLWPPTSGAVTTGHQVPLVSPSPITPPPAVRSRALRWVLSTRSLAGTTRPQS
jgi:hypothetical protein